MQQSLIKLTLVVTAKVLTATENEFSFGRSIDDAVLIMLKLLDRVRLEHIKKDLSPTENVVRLERSSNKLNKKNILSNVKLVTEQNA